MSTEISQTRARALPDDATNSVGGRNRLSKPMWIALVVLALIVTTAAAPPEEAAALQGPLIWEPCPERQNLECSTLDVPLDYRSPNGQMIEIKISRLASKNPAKRRGILLTNPGGPGLSGLHFPATLAASGLPQRVRDAYDIIGFDPRGVGRSAPVTCDLTPEQEQRGTIPRWADGPRDVAADAVKAKAIAQQCATSSTAWMLPHITTANTARDMDRIRVALGEPTLSYLGYSYGTHLGSVYTTLFPRRGDRIVIDSNLAPGGMHVDGTRLMARGLEDRFPDFARWMAARDDEYGMGSTPRQVRAKYFELAAKLDANPINWLDGSAFRVGNHGSTYRDADFPVLAGIWQAAAGEVPVPDLPPDPTRDNLVSSHFHVICGDNRWPRSVRSYQLRVEIDRVRYPMFGASTASIRPCAFWPEPVEPAVRVNDRGPSNVLMIQNFRDPGTPLVGALKLRRAFGQRARMVAVDAGGHSSYLFVGNKCADHAVNSFLVDGRWPERDRFCAAERAQGRG